MNWDFRENPGARFLLVAACFVVVVAGLRAAATILLPFFIALLLAILSLPLLGWLQDRGVPTVVSVALTVLAGVSVFGIFALYVMNTLDQFATAAPRYVERLQAMWLQGLESLRARDVAAYQWVSEDLINMERLMDLIRGTLWRIATVLQNVLLILLFMVFILLEAANFPDKLQAMFRRKDDLERMRRMTREIQRYLGLKTLVGLATGGLVAAWTALMGLEFPLLWGLVAFVLNYIPALGSILAAIPAVALALVDLGPGPAAIVALGYVVINVTIGNLVEPFLMGRRLGLSPLVVFFSLVFWGWAWGPVGMLLSVPLTMIVKIVLENTEDFRWVGILLDTGPPESAAPPRQTTA